MQSALAFVVPEAPQTRSVIWPGGRLEWGMRPPTSVVESRIIAHAPMLLVTLAGGARHAHHRADDGMTYDGPDLAGSFTFLPAGCTRELSLRDVAWRWAILTLPVAGTLSRAFHSRRDAFVRELVGSMRAVAADAAPDVAFLETASLLASHHLRLCCGGARTEPGQTPLSRPQLRRLEDYVLTHLSEPLRIADLAAMLGMSAGHFHRRFLATTGATPWSWIVQRRIAAAKALLAAADRSVLDVALAVGIASPSRFAQQFRRATGVSPKDYRKAFLGG
jgi:AraC family transcriptional regulator